MKVQMRTVYDHFNKIDLTPDIFATHWIISLFTTDLQKEIVSLLIFKVYRIIDLFCIDGFSVVI